MRVHFVFAPPNIQPKFGEVIEGMLPPLGILYLAGYLREYFSEGDLEIRATDGLIKSLKETIDEVRAFDPDVLCVSHLTAASLGAYELINTLKSAKKELLVITGGAHSSALPEDVLTRSYTDVVVLGEGEITLHEIVSLFARNGSLDPPALKKIPGIAFKDEDGTIRRNPARPYANLDSMPFPARDILPAENYHGFYLCKRPPEAPMMISRGCPADCVFCANAHWKLCKPYVRIRSPKNIVDEMVQLYKLGYREIQDTGDEFNNDLKNAMAICQEIKTRGLDIAWKTSLRAHPLPEELVKLMAETGCWFVHLGIESGNEETLRGIKKFITLAQIEDACRLLKNYGIKVHGLFMLFNVWEENKELKFESVEATKNTLRFSERLIDKGLLDYVGWSMTTPYPGSELYDIACRHDLIKKHLKGNWDAWIRDDPIVIRLPGVSQAEMAALKRKGSFIRAKCMLRNRHFGLKDIPLLAKKTTKVLLSEVNARFTG